MEGLRELHVHLLSQRWNRGYWRNWSSDDVEEFKLLGPIKAVTRPEIFELDLPYDRPN